MYLDTIAEIFESAKFTIIDPQLKGVLPLFGKTDIGVVIAPVESNKTTSNRIGGNS